MSLTAADVRAAMCARYPGESHAICYEVARSTGHAANRHLDMIVMDLWPSRGLALHGIEIKVSRGDLLRELKDPAKADEIGRYCDFFWIAAPKGVAKPDELPLAWGLIEVTDTATSRVVKQAQRIDAAPIDRSFLAAMLRGATRGAGVETVTRAVSAALNRMQEENHKTFDQRIARELERERKHRDDMNRDDASNWRKLVEAIGEGEANRFMGPTGESLVRAIKVVRRLKLENSYGSIRELGRSLQQAQELLAPVIGEIEAVHTEKS